MCGGAPFSGRRRKEMEEKEKEKEKKKRKGKEIPQFYIYKLPIDRPEAVTGIELILQHCNTMISKVYNNILSTYQ